MKTLRLIVITVLPEPQASQFKRIRDEASRLSGAKAALTYPAHVTLRTGARIPEDAVSSFIEGLGGVVKGLKPFRLTTDGFDCRLYGDADKQKCLVAYKVLPTIQLLDAHHSLLSYSSYQRAPQNEYWPHLTLAFDDLTEAGFTDLQRRLAKRESPFDASFMWICDNVCLYVQSGHQWVELHRYNLA